MTPNHFTRHLLELQLDRGGPKKILATQAGLHRTYISNVERAERNIHLGNVEKLADAFDIVRHAGEIKP